MKGDYVLSKEAARYFYIGIAGDSGRFQYSSTSQHTFAIAGELLKTGINISKIYQEMYLKQIDDLYVTAYVLGHFKISEHGVAYYVLDKKTQEDLKITTESHTLCDFFPCFIPFHIVFIHHDSHHFRDC